MLGHAARLVELYLRYSSPLCTPCKLGTCEPPLLTHHVCGVQKFDEVFYSIAVSLYAMWVITLPQKIADTQYVDARRVVHHYWFQLPYTGRPDVLCTSCNGLNSSCYIKLEHVHHIYNNRRPVLYVLVNARLGYQRCSSTPSTHTSFVIFLMYCMVLFCAHRY